MARPPEAFQSHSIRVVTLEGNPWFVVPDVCRCLGLAPAGNGHGGEKFTHHLRNVQKDERTELRRGALLIPPNLFPTRRHTRASLISESGLHKLIMRSDKPQAKAFQDWVTKDVLPSIRKDGAYVMGEPCGLFSGLGCGLGKFQSAQTSSGYQGVKNRSLALDQFAPLREALFAAFEEQYSRHCVGRPQEPYDASCAAAREPVLDQLLIAFAAAVAVI